MGAGGRLDWLPQETILYEGAGLARRTEVQLDDSATCLLSEMVVLGRGAMGETVSRLAFTDRRQVIRGGRPVWIEPLELLDRHLGQPSASAGIEDARALVGVESTGHGVASPAAISSRSSTIIAPSMWRSPTAV